MKFKPNYKKHQYKNYLLDMILIVIHKKLNKQMHQKVL